MRKPWIKSGKKGPDVKLLFVHEVSYRKKVIFEMHEFPELLSLRGHDVSFLEFDEGRKFWNKSKSKRSELILGRVHNTAKLNLLRPWQLGVPGLDRILVFLTVIPYLAKILRTQSFDAIVLYAVPTYGLQTLWLANKYRVPVMFRALDVSHKIRIPLLSPVIKCFEKHVYRRSALLSANNPAMARYCKELGRRTLETRVHFPPLDVSHFEKAKRDPVLRAELGFSDLERVIVYMGSFFYFSGLSAALEEFAKISASNQRLRFLLIGGGEQRNKLEKSAVSLGIGDKVVFAGVVDYNNLAKYLKIADIGVNTLEPILATNFAFPHKVLQYMAAGLPVVSTKLEGLLSVFKNEYPITWEADAQGVMAKASELGNKLAFSQTEKTAGDANLLRFSLEATLVAFESDLATLVKRGGT